MMIVSSFLISLITSANLLTVLASEEVVLPVPLGYVVLGVVIIPVFSLIVASIVDKPRTFKIPMLFIASLVIIAGGLLLGFVVFGAVIDLVFPK